VFNGAMMLIALLLFVQDAPKPPPPVRGLVKSAESAFPGYTLVAPLQSTDTTLVDMQGNVVHRWKSDAPPGQSVYLTEQGHLLRAERVDNEVFRGGGIGGRIREFDWDGKLVWEYTLSNDQFCMHHDFERLPSGNLLVIAWELKTPSEARALGLDADRAEQGFWPDCVLEIEPVLPSGGRIVWEWHAADHLIQERDEKLANFARASDRPERAAVDARGVSAAPGADPAERERLRALGYIGGDEGPAGRGPGGRGGRGGPGGAADWMHTNGLDHDPVRDLIVLSLRNLNEIWVIDHSTTTEEAKGSKGGKQGKGGDLLMRWGNPQAWGAGEAKDQRLSGQHDAQFIPQGHPGAGNILVFNNGGKDGTSEVLEIPVVLNDFVKLREVQPVWNYGSKKIYSSHISGAQRLPNGNTLIASGSDGLLLEVNTEGEEVWEWKSTEKGDIAPSPGGRRGGPGGPPPGAGPGGPGAGGPGAGGPGGRRGRGPGGPGGPGSEYSLFRADRYALDFPGVARLKPAAPPK
jgi:hypothetical protein